MPPIKCLEAKSVKRLESNEVGFNTEDTTLNVMPSQRDFDALVA